MASRASVLGRDEGRALEPLAPWGVQARLHDDDAGHAGTTEGTRHGGAGARGAGGDDHGNVGVGVHADGHASPYRPDMNESRGRLGHEGALEREGELARGAVLELYRHPHALAAPALALTSPADELAHLGEGDVVDASHALPSYADRGLW